MTGGPWLFERRLSYSAASVDRSASAFCCAFSARSASAAARFLSSSRISSSRFSAICRRLVIMPPVPAGISRPTMTFSFRPSSVSILPLTAASVSTRVVSWNEAAEMNDRVCRLALVMPSNTGTPSAISFRSSASRSLISSNSRRSSCSPAIRSESPGLVISTFCSIWRTITSMCLSLINTPCSR